MLELTDTDETIISHSDQLNYAAVLNGALNIHLDREKVRHGLWKEYPAKDQAQQVKIKADRVMHTLELIEKKRSVELSQQEDPLNRSLEDATIEELYDIINYSVFAVRKLKGE